MPTVDSNNTPNPWGQQTTSASAHGDASLNLAQAKSKSMRVPDDWDDDDEEEETDSQKIWETANTKSPMPQLVISRPSTSTTVISPPPSTVIQAPMKILKRSTPTSTPSNTSSTSPSLENKTLAEREARYQEARERIFGGSSKASGHDVGSKDPNAAT